MTKDELFSAITTIGGKHTYPFDYSSENYDYLDFVLKLLGEYLSLLDSLDEESLIILNKSLPEDIVNFPLSRPLSLLEDAHAVADIVKEVLYLSYRTHHSEAYNKLLEFFSKDDHHFFNLLPRLEMRNDVYYRMRTGYIDWSNPQGEMFHIPFQLRHKVSTQRYSIPGYPVIYLASALETSWYELNQPDVLEVTIAKFKFKDMAIFIDLGYPLTQNPSGWEFYCLFVFYPLFIACSVRVKYPDAPFKVEYLMPQLMLRVVRNYDIITGISYMSNKTPLQDDVFSLYYRNYVVITKNALCREGYDAALASKMQMSKPFRFEKMWFEKHGIEDSSNLAKIGLGNMCHTRDKFEDIVLTMRN